MMDKADISSSSPSDSFRLQQIGEFIKAIRLEQNKTQQEVADAAGLHRTTVSQMENGTGGTLQSLLQILRVLRALYVLDQMKVIEKISPLRIAELEQKQRKRARHSVRENRKQADW
jgi:transcriptional regulator with XRE-family HTH domain